jgi:HECT-domain (ubiquitin-transferase)
MISSPLLSSPLLSSHPFSMITPIQAWYRACRNVRDSRAGLRQSWDQELVSLGSESALKLTHLNSISTLVRQLLAFFEFRKDAKRLLSLVRVVCSSFTRKTEHVSGNYALLACSNDIQLRMQFLVQMRELALLVLHTLVDKCTQTEDALILSRFLHLLVSDNKWPADVVDQDQAQHRNGVLFRVVLYLHLYTNANGGLFPAIRQVILKLCTVTSPSHDLRQVPPKPAVLMILFATTCMRLAYSAGVPAVLQSLGSAGGTSTDTIMLDSKTDDSKSSQPQSAIAESDVLELFAWTHDSVSMAQTKRRAYHISSSTTADDVSMRTQSMSSASQTGGANGADEEHEQDSGPPRTYSGFVSFGGADSKSTPAAQTRDNNSPVSSSIFDASRRSVARPTAASATAASATTTTTTTSITVGNEDEYVSSSSDDDQYESSEDESQRPLVADSILRPDQDTGNEITDQTEAAPNAFGAMGVPSFSSARNNVAATATSSSSSSSLFGQRSRPFSTHSYDLSQYMSHNRNNNTNHPKNTSDAQKWFGWIDAPETNIYWSFVNHILSIPLLCERLGIACSAIHKLPKHPSWTTCMSSLSSIGSSVLSTACSLASPSHSYFDSLSPQSTVSVGQPVSRGGWLLANLAAVLSTNLSSISRQVCLAHIAAMQSVLTEVHSSDFPSAGSSHHPMYVATMKYLYDPSLLDWVSNLLVDTTTSNTHIQNISVSLFLSTVLRRWRQSQQAIMRQVLHGSSLLQSLWALLCANNGEILTKIYLDWNAPEADVLSLLSVIFRHITRIQDDAEFKHFVVDVFGLDNLQRLVDFICSLLGRMYWSEFDDCQASTTAVHLRTRLSLLFSGLRERHARQPLVDSNVWIMESIVPTTFQTELMGNSPRAIAILREIPFVLSFEQRVAILYKLIDLDRKAEQTTAHADYFSRGHGASVRIRRSHIIEDGFKSLSSIGARLKGRVLVSFVDEHGINEAGIDGGGLFKEFFTQLIQAVFDPQYALFVETEDHCAYPNPHYWVVDTMSDSKTTSASSVAAGSLSNHNSAFGHGRGRGRVRLYYFVGQIVGKALYDGITMGQVFANFFLRKMLGKTNTLDDLASLDRQIYKNVLLAKQMNAGTIEDLGLTMSVDESVLGVRETMDLVPNGRHIAVTEDNKLDYVYELAHLKLNRQINEQAVAFMEGMQSVIPVDWLRMFAADELSLLLSGKPHVDLSELRACANYSGGYSVTHELILWFWDIVLNEFDDKDRSDFLTFVTSCPRAPLLGFTSLDPKFCIQHGGGDQAKLPSAGTCFNLLKLPRYSSRQVLKEKLLYAIRSGSGFGLS